MKMVKISEEFDSDQKTSSAGNIFTPPLKTKKAQKPRDYRVFEPFDDKKRTSPSLYQKLGEDVAPYAELDTIRRNYRTALTLSYNSLQSITFFPVIPDFIMHAQKKDAHELYMQLIRPIVI